MSEIDEIKGWVAGRVPADWYQGTPEVSVDREEIVVIGSLKEAKVEGGDDAQKAAAAGRVKQHREDTREKRMQISNEAEHRFERPRALTTPVVTVDWKPSGSPMAMTSCPTRSASESPRVTAGNTAALSARITARSVLGSEPTTDAASSVPSWSVMRGCAPPSTTCAFVSR